MLRGKQNCKIRINGESLTGLTGSVSFDKTLMIIHFRMSYKQEDERETLLKKEVSDFHDKKR